MNWKAITCALLGHVKSGARLHHPPTSEQINAAKLAGANQILTRVTAICTRCGKEVNA